MSVAYQQLIQHLEEHGIRYDVSEGREMILASFRIDSGAYRIVAYVDAEDELFQVFGLIPNAVPAGSRPAIAEMITRANYDLRIGKFEMDFSDGELRYQVYHALGGVTLDDATIRRAIVTTLGMLDRYVPAFLSVIYANESPEDAIRHAEVGMEQPDSSH